MTAILKRDFQSFFTSPLGFVFCGVFIFITYLVFFIYNILGQSSDVSGLFSFLVQTLMFLLPLLTMKLMSEELKQKTDQLLLTSPVSVTEIVLGKYLAAMGVVAVALVATLACPLVVSLFGQPAEWQIIGNYLMLALAMGVLVSIGLFISSLTESQLIAAILSYVIFFAIYILSMVGGAIQVPIIQTVVRFISIFTRFSNLTNGILLLSDIVYFLSVIVVFLFLSTRVLEKRRWS